MTHKSVIKAILELHRPVLVAVLSDSEDPDIEFVGVCEHCTTIELGPDRANWGYSSSLYPCRTVEIILNS